MHPRTYLFVPGDRPDRFDKAWASDADAVVLDLEDAVAPDRKSAARDAIAGWLAPERPVWLRVNAAGSAAHDADLALLGRPGLAGLLLPKAEAVPEALQAALRAHGLGLLALVETARGVRDAETLAATSGVARLAFGALDFQADCGIADEGDGLLAFRSALVLASRLAGLPPPVDGVTPDVRDPERTRADAARAKGLGFGAKLCVHPAQVAAVHAAFAPTDAERAWAARVLAANAASGGGAVAVDGAMVDRPVVLRAEAIAAAGPSRRRAAAG
jgi:citrate lyase subunit beta/citryl-CoA lyase